MADPRPNFILVIADQMRGDCLGIDGHPCVQTPNLDAMAAGGARFARAYSTCPSCVPARRSLMCGQSPQRNGMVGMQGDPSWEPDATLPGELTKAGYQTALVGRTMHWTPGWRRYGFEEMQLSVTLNSSGPPSDYDLALLKHAPEEAGGFAGHGVDYNGYVARPWHLDETLHETHWTITRAIRWLQRRDPARPFFLLVSLFHPHPPLTPPGHYLDRYLRMEMPAPAIGDWAQRPPHDGLGLPPDSDVTCLKGQLLRQAQAGYFGLINHIDDQITRLTAVHGGVPAHARRNTILAFTSDHGEMLGDHHLFRKTYPYEGSARVPLIFHGPGIERGVVCDRPVHQADVMPTILDLAGVDVPASCDGRSLAGVLRGEADGPDRDVLHGEHAVCYRPEQAYHSLTDGRIKYIWFSQTGVERLFDLAADPTECRDLAGRAEHAEELRRWRGRLIERLADRPEGFVEDGTLVPGRPHRNLLPDIEAAAREAAPRYAHLDRGDVI